MATKFQMPPIVYIVWGRRATYELSKEVLNIINVGIWSHRLLDEDKDD